MHVWCVCIHAKAWKTKGFWGHAPQGIFFLKLVLWDFFGQNQSRSSLTCIIDTRFWESSTYACMARGITASNFWLSTYSAFAMPADFEFRREKALLRLTELERQLVNSRAPKIAIYFTHVVFTRASFHRSGVNMQLTRAFGAGPPWTNSHRCNQTRLDGCDS